jgi:hypothetical protein
MQEPTHILAGIIIQRSVQLTYGRRAGAPVLTAVTAFLSHGLLDRLANFTYHPPEADFHDPFWVAYHSCVLLAKIVFLWLWWRPFKLGVLCAMLPDLEETQRQPVLLTVTPALPTPAGVLTRHTNTLLIINNLRDSDPPQSRHKPATDPQHSPW